MRSSPVAMLLIATAVVALGCNAPALVATPSPSTAALPTSTAVPSPTRGTSPAAGWRFLADFPANGAWTINSLVAVESGFVAVGSRFDADAPCFNDANHGLVWTSSDGTSWVAQPDDVFAQAAPWTMFAQDDALMVIGFVGSGDPAISCNEPAEPGINLWRSTDGGTTWQRLARPSGLDGARIADVAVADGRIIAVGSRTHEQQEEDVAGAWTSADGIDWQLAEIVPAVPRLSVVAASGDRAVAFADCCDGPLAWVSRDRGRNWYEASLSVPLGPDDFELELNIADVAAGEGAFVAVGEGCCLTGEAETVPVALVSGDGEDWQAALVAVEGEAAMERLVSVPAGWLALGRGALSGTEAGGVGGRSWTSPDGLNWQAGPPLAELGAGFISAVAVGASGIVAAGPGDTSSLHVWFAPLDSLR